MKTRYRITAPLLAVGVLVSAIAGQCVAEPDRLDRLARRLDLTDEQRQSLSNMQEEMSVNRVRKSPNEELRSLIAAGQVDAAADLAAQEARDRTYGLAERRARMAEILTPEQLEQMEELRSQWGQRRRGKGWRN